MAWLVMGGRYPATLCLIRIDSQNLGKAQLLTHQKLIVRRASDFNGILNHKNFRVLSIIFLLLYVWEFSTNLRFNLEDTKQFRMVMEDETKLFVKL